jgi:hypothetical protein
MDKDKPDDRSSLPPENSPATQFNIGWASYRDGQRTMLHSVVTYLNQIGHPGLAKRVNDQFNQ